MHDNLILLAGGLSSRMKNSKESSTIHQSDIEQANQRSKGLISVGASNRPILDYLLFNAKKAGYKNIYIVVSEKSLPLFKEFYGANNHSNNFKGLIIGYAIQMIPKNREKPLGTADALLQALEQYPILQKKSFTVCNSDNLYSETAFRCLREIDSAHAFINYKREALQFSYERIARFAITKLNNENYLEDIIEKPELQEIKASKDIKSSVGVSMNIFKFNGTDFYNYLKECPIHPDRDEKELPKALLNMVNDGIPVLGISLAEHVPDLTAKEDIAVVRAYLLENYPVLNW